MQDTQLVPPAHHRAHHRSAASQQSRAECGSSGWASGALRRAAAAYDKFHNIIMTYVSHVSYTERAAAVDDKFQSAV